MKTLYLVYTKGEQRMSTDPTIAKYVKDYYPGYSIIDDSDANEKYDILLKNHSSVIKVEYKNIDTTQYDLEVYNEHIQIETHQYMARYADEYYKNRRDFVDEKDNTYHTSKDWIEHTLDGRDLIVSTGWFYQSQCDRLFYIKKHGNVNKITDIDFQSFRGWISSMAYNKDPLLYSWDIKQAKVKRDNINMGGTNINVMLSDIPKAFYYEKEY